MATPAGAQDIPRVVTGESVVVTLRDGRVIMGEVKDSFSDLGFYVKPPDTAAFLMHREDVVSIRATSWLAVRSATKLPTERQDTRQCDSMQAA